MGSAKGMGPQFVKLCVLGYNIRQLVSNDLQILMLEWAGSI